MATQYYRPRPGSSLFDGIYEVWDETETDICVVGYRPNGVKTVHQLSETEFEHALQPLPHDEAKPLLASGGWA